MNILEQIKNKFTLNKPLALQWHEWEEWEVQMKKERPLAYWLNETVPDFFDDIYRTITKPFNDLRCWIRYRTFDKYHIIDTGLKPNYYDIDEIMMHGMFQLLVDFVEIEKAWMQVIWSNDEDKKYHVPWYCKGKFKTKNWRCKEAGLEYLNWECTLGSPKLPEEEQCASQAQTAYEIIDLYKWWTEVRPNRLDPMDASGWSAYCNKRKEQGYSVLDTRHDTPEDEQENRKLLDLNRKIEEEQHKEDEEMLIRLIKIRRSLWT